MPTREERIAALTRIVGPQAGLTEEADTLWQAD